jgi:hypothetical protein
MLHNMLQKIARGNLGVSSIIDIFTWNLVAIQLFGGICLRVVPTLSLVSLSRLRWHHGGRLHLYPTSQKRYTKPPLALNYSF